MDQEFIDPTPAGTAKLVAAWFVAIAGYLASDHYWPHFMGFIRSQALCEQVRWLNGLAGTFAGLMVLVAAVLAWHGYRILRYRQLPLPGAVVLSRTPIKRGDAVLIHGYAYCALGLAMLLGCWYVLPKLWVSLHPGLFAGANCGASPL